MLLYGATGMTTSHREECEMSPRGSKEKSPSQPEEYPSFTGPVANNSGRRSGSTPRRAIQRDEVTHY
jgi:hypothetical protein